MKAARFHGRGDIRIDDVPEPTPGPGQVQVAVDWCGICGTDLHEYLEGPIFIPPKGSPHPITGAELPVVMGHEFAGVVSAVGSGRHRRRGGRQGRGRALLRVRRVRRVRRRSLQHLPQARLHRAGRAGRRLRREVRRRPALDPPPRRPAHRRRRPGRAARGGLPRGAAVRDCKPGGTAVVFGAGPIGLVTAASLKAVGAGQVISVETAAARKAKASVAGRRRGARPDRDERAGRGARAHRRRRRGRRVRVRRHRRGAGLGDRLGPPRRHRGERGDLGPPGHRADERPGAVRRSTSSARWPTAATTRTRSRCCRTGRSPPSSSSPAGSGWTTWSRAVSGS